MKKSYVYLGLIAAEGDSFSVKVGKTNHPEKREKQYATHCPGGLQSMYAVELPSSAEAFAAEFRLRSKIREMPFAVIIGGEWTRVAGSNLGLVFEALEEFGEPFRVECSLERRAANCLANQT